MNDTTESRPCSVALAAGVETLIPAAFSYARPPVHGRERRSCALPLVQVSGGGHLLEWI